MAEAGTDRGLRPKREVLAQVNEARAPKRSRRGLFPWVVGLGATAASVATLAQFAQSQEGRDTEKVLRPGWVLKKAYVVGANLRSEPEIPRSNHNANVLFKAGDYSGFVVENVEVVQGVDVTGAQLTGKETRKLDNTGLSLGESWLKAKVRDPRTGEEHWVYANLWNINREAPQGFDAQSGVFVERNGNFFFRTDKGIRRINQGMAIPLKVRPDA